MAGWKNYMVACKCNHNWCISTLRCTICHVVAES